MHSLHARGTHLHHRCGCRLGWLVGRRRGRLIWRAWNARLLRQRCISRVLLLGGCPVGFVRCILPCGSAQWQQLAPPRRLPMLLLLTPQLQQLLPERLRQAGVAPRLARQARSLMGTLPLLAGPAAQMPGVSAADARGQPAAEPGLTHHQQPAQLTAVRQQQQHGLSHLILAWSSLSSLV